MAGWARTLTWAFAIIAPLAATSGPGTAAAAVTGHASPGRTSARAVVVRNLHDSGTGSLRSAILIADHRHGRRGTIVVFSVSGVIRLASRLPAISARVIIDATSAPGHARGGPPRVEIDCEGHRGLWLAAGSAGSALLGLAVGDAGGDGITLRAGRITIDDDYIGLDLAGGPLGNRGAGIYVSPASRGNDIGLNPSGASGVIANVISGNAGSGIVLAGSSGNTISANRIGTNPAGTSAVPNGGNGLTVVRRSDHNEIGGTVFVDSRTGQANDPTGEEGTVPPVFVVPPLGNLISGNAKAGIRIAAGSAGNVLNGNFVGTSADGDKALGNHGGGVVIDHADRNSLTGCRLRNNPFVYYNVISANGGDGLLIDDSDGTTVQGNFFGIGANNTSVLGNLRNGIAVTGTSANTQVGGVIPLGNVAAGNRANGIAVTGTARGFVTFNTFGGLLAFKGAAPNGHDGLLITSSGGDNLARTNVFSGNRGNGIELAGNARGVTIDPAIAGLTTKGDAALPNGRDGVLIDGNAHANVVGGTLRSVIPQNTFSGNAGYGLAITGAAHANRVFSTFIGTNIGGIAALGNGKGGVLIGGSARGNAIGELVSRPVDLISGNSGNGVTLLARTAGNRVTGNLIGLNRARRCLPNSGRPVADAGRRNLVVRNRKCR